MKHLRKISLVVEGDSDYYALPVLLDSVDVTISRRSAMHGQPVGMPVDMMARLKIVPLVERLLSVQSDAVCIIIDREQRCDCPGDLATRVRQAVVSALRDRQITYTQQIWTVVCDRSLENWIIADCEGLESCNLIAKPIAPQVGSNADGKDAISIIKSAYVRGRSFNKARDLPRLARHVNVLSPRVQARSKSLCKLLRTLLS